MDPLTTLLNWLAPVLDPLADFRKQVEKLTGIHQSSVHTFSALAGSLIDVPTGPNAFTGKLASSFWEDAQAYLNAENALMGGGTTVGLAGESGVEEAAIACEECVAEITADAGVAATEMAGDVVLDEVTGIVDVAAVAEGGANPIADVAGIILTLVAGAVLLASLTKLAWDIYNSIQQWQRSMYRAGDTPLPQLPPNPQPVATPTPFSGPSNSLSPAQQRLLNDVKSRLGTTSYNDAEIEALIRAGYLDPDAIAAIIKGGSYAVFSNPSDAANIATLMKELTPAQQQQFIAIVEQYQKTHPGLTSHQIYNYLQYIKMKAQLKILSDSITGKDPTDILSLAILNKFPMRTHEMSQRLYQTVDKSMDAITDPFTVSNDDLDGWYGNVTGIGAEWASVKHYYSQGQLVDFSVPLPPLSSGKAGGEVDIKINENGIEKWVELKNVLSSKGQWGPSLIQARKYVQNGAKAVILQFPQLGVSGNPTLSQQQLNNLQTLRHDYPGVTFELRTGASDPSIRIPFAPPSDNWGGGLP